MIWKTIPGFSQYEVSESGEVRRSIHLNHYGKPGRRNKPGQLLKPAHPKSGYQSLTLKWDAGPIESVGVHVLVALAFLGPKPFPKAEVLHKDDNRSNNHISNIRWGTHQDNMLDCVKNGKPRPKNARLTPEEVRHIRKLHKEGMPGTEIAIIYQQHFTSIYDVINRTYYKDVL